MSKDKSLFKKSIDWMLHADKYKYTYNFEWAGIPIIKFPNDLLVKGCKISGILQEIIEHKSKKFLIIGSAHNYKEIKIKEKQSVDIIFLSSLFKKNKNYLGINRFKLISKLTKKKIVALGGISKNNLKKMSLLNCFGYAAISYFE